MGIGLEDPKFCRLNKPTPTIEPLMRSTEEPRCQNPPLRSQTSRYQNRFQSLQLAQEILDIGADAGELLDWR